MRLRLVLTKFGAPPVRIGWTVGIGRKAVTSRTQSSARLASAKGVTRMTFVRVTPRSTPPGPIEDMCGAARARYGYVPNMVKPFSRRPGGLRRLAGAERRLEKAWTPRRYELATPRPDGCARAPACSRTALLVERQLLGAETLRDALVDRAASGLEPVDLSVTAFAEKVVDDATSIDEADVERLPAHGLSDADILDVVLAAAVRCF